MSLPVLTSAYRYVETDEATGEPVTSCSGFVARTVQSLQPLFILLKNVRRAQIRFKCVARMLATVYVYVITRTNYGCFELDGA